MKLLTIDGSPRVGGNTDTLLAEAVRGAAAAGAETETVYLRDLAIAPCEGCDACAKNGTCKRQDDFPPLLSKLLEADAWLLGTPVYWWGPSAQMKAFIDRWYAPVHNRDLKSRMAKRVGLVSPFGDADPGTARHLVGMLQDLLDYLQADFLGTVLVTANERGGVARNAQAMRQAYDLGQKLVTR